jgi:hypothetical protein
VRLVAVGERDARRRPVGGDVLDVADVVGLVVVLPGRRQEGERDGEREVGAADGEAGADETLPAPRARLGSQGDGIQGGGIIAQPLGPRPPSRRIPRPAGRRSPADAMAGWSGRTGS